MKAIDYIENFERWRSGFTFSIPIKVRFSETDLYGHVNNTSVFVYFEEARIEYLQSLGLFTDIEKEKAGIVVADLQCDYLEQMYFNETIHFYVKINEVGNASFDMHYMAINEKNKVTITGRGKIVYIDLIKKRAKAIPKDVRAVLEREIEKTQQVMD